ncbi:MULTISPECIES: hypothetical protein [Deefgea]|uniref:Uncharacterized protein n=1 Tax=Deefgea chitinilytica TaxID=570276 RepID=A0ABS2CF99_9NEIS|nr:MULTISPECIES: hypothetical protein [Deefgea]MBM5572061.1 hypothetical protein [Deefgea chitinilytica]MBM9889296.1 hypothetical protein [Deefgea sp. CFH1-16]
MKSTLIITLMMLAGLAQAQEYYKGDPAKLAALEAQRCAKISKEQSLIQRRLTGNNQPYDVRKMQDKLKVLQADYAKYCPPKPTP